MIIELFDRRNQLIGRLHKTDNGIKADSTEVDSLLSDLRVAGRDDAYIWNYFQWLNNGYLRGQLVSAPK